MLSEFMLLCCSTRSIIMVMLAGLSNQYPHCCYHQIHYTFTTGVSKSATTTRLTHCPSTMLL